MITTYSCIHINHKKVKRFVLFITFIFFFLTIAFISKSYSQSIQVTNIQVIPVCAGNTVTVTFSTTSGNGVGNKYDNDTQYYLYLSDNNGTNYNHLSSFKTTNISYCGNNCTTTGIQTSITIPSNTIAGNNYKIAIISSNPNFNYSSGASTPFTIHPLSVSGTVSSNQTICSGNSPSNITLTGQTGTIQWQSSADNLTFTNISGATSTTLTSAQIGSLTATRYYRALVTSGVCSVVNSNVVTITVNPTSIPGTASSNQTICSGSSPSNITLTGQTGTIQWQSSADNITFTNISGATSTILTSAQIGSLTATRYYRALVTSGVCSVVNSNVVTITVNPTSMPGTASSNQTICSGSSPSNITLTGQTGTIQWQSSADNITFTNISGATSNTLTSAQIGSLTATRYYRAQVKSGVCSVVNSNVVTITVNPNNISFWTGVIDSDWNKSGNWRCDVLPTSIIDIIIPSVGVINFPIVTNDLIISNIDIQNGATVTVSNHELRINGILTLNGKIDLQNESQLIQSGTSTLVTSGCTGIIEIDQQGTSDNFKYNYWSSPVSSVCNTTNYTIAGVLRDGTFPNNIKNINYGAAYTYADVKVVPVDNPTTSIKLSTYWMYKYTNKSAGDYSAWTAIGNSGNLLAGEGFTLKGSNSTLPIQNYTFVGKPNNGDINLTITTGKQYLIGNPYPSALKADDFIKDNIKQYSKIDGTVIGGNRTSDIIDGNLYFWDHFGGGTHFLKSYEGGYSIYNLSGPTKAVSTDARIKVTSNESNKSAQKWIPVAQGFFVTAKDGGQIEFKNSQREYKKENINVSQFLKTTGKSSSKEQETSEDLTPRIYLKFSAPSGLHRQILTAIIPNTSDELDIGYDALNNETFSDDMSWATAAGKMVIQAVPTLDNERILPLEVKVSTTGIARISIDKLENISIKTALFLRDNTTGTLTNLKENVFEVNLNPGNYVNRFELILKTEQTLSVDDEKLPPNFISIYLDNTNHILYINKTSIVEIHKIDFYNIIGQLVFSSTKNEKTNSFNLPQDMQTGVYILKVKTDKGLVIKKLINP